VPAEQIRVALAAHWEASASGDIDMEHEIYADDAICDDPQSGERILGRHNLQSLRGHHPGKPSGFDVKRISGAGGLWVTEYTITYGGPAVLRRQHHGIPGRKGGPRDAVFHRTVSCAGIA
jgi:hypothetical protein